MPETGSGCFLRLSELLTDQSARRLRLAFASSTRSTRRLFSGSESHVVKLARFWTHVVQLSLHFIVHVFLVSEVCQGSLRDPERLVDEPTGAD